MRRELDRDASKLASPRLWPDTVVSLAKTGRRVLGAAAPDAPLALLTAAASGAGLPIAPPSSTKGTIERAQRLVRAGGPAYIKLGQFIASSQGLLPEEWVEAFAWCRDDAPHLEPGIAESIMARELGLTALVDFAPHPIAAGSIGQVHTARLPDGLEVVVKIRRPGLRARFRRDIETLALVSAAADRLRASAPHRHPRRAAQHPALRPVPRRPARRQRPDPRTGPVQPARLRHLPYEPR